MAESASATVFGASQTRILRRDLVELGVAYALILATLWTANPTQRVLYWLAFAWILATSWVRREGWKTLGLGTAGLLPSLWVVVVALLGTGVAMFLALRMHTLHRLHGPTPLVVHMGGYAVWAMMQQFILQSYFLRRLMRLLPGKALPIAAAAVMFALAHLPSPALTPVTLIWGAISCMLFLRYRNVYTLGLAHGILGLCVAMTVPNSLHHHMRVGLGYYRYKPQPASITRHMLPPQPQSYPQQILSSPKWRIPAPIKEIRVPNNSMQSAIIVIEIKESPRDIGAFLIFGLQKVKLCGMGCKINSKPFRMTILTITALFGRF
jgi:Type II CAAX prenyl endopeptidase Rce1-like